MGIHWSRREARVQAGEYAQAQAKVTEWVSEDGRFTIIRFGRMAHKRANGVRGPLAYRWVWSGYRLVDHAPELPSYISKSVSRPSVGECKRVAEQRVRGI